MSKSAEYAEQQHEPFTCEFPVEKVNGMGMFHCPGCNHMVVAGMPHPPLECEVCGEDEKPVYLVDNDRGTDTLMCELCRDNPERVASYDPNTPDTH